MASSTLYEGWGRSTWSDGSFGTPILKVSVDGVEATGAVGAVTVTADANVSPSGLEATGAVGTVTVSGEANIPVTGLEATGNVGSVTVQANADVSVTGLEATGAVGTVTMTGDANVSVTGVEATSAVGSATVSADANVPVTMDARGNGLVGEVTAQPSRPHRQPLRRAVFRGVPTTVHLDPRGCTAHRLRNRLASVGEARGHRVSRGSPR